MSEMQSRMEDLCQAAGLTCQLPGHNHYVSKCGHGLRLAREA